MASDVQELVAAAVSQAYENWAAEHPSLAGVIDRIELTQQTTERLRTTTAYHDAVEEYNQSNGELAFANRLLDLVSPLLLQILGG